MAHNNIFTNQDITISAQVLKTWDQVTVGHTTSMITITLDATPADRDEIRIKDGYGNATLFPITIAGNGHNIDGYATVTLGTAFDALDLYFNASLNRWCIQSQITLGQGSSVTISGDVTGTTSSATVVALRGVTVSPNAPADGNVLSYVASNHDWEPVASPSLPVNGDVTGTLPATTVAKIQGHTVVNTLPTDGQVMTWNGGTSRWEPTSYGGDVIGDPEASTVTKLQGNPVQSGALGSAQDGYVLTWTNADNQWEAKSVASDTINVRSSGLGQSVAMTSHAVNVTGTAATLNAGFQIWQPSDAGKTIIVVGAGAGGSSGSNFYTTILTYNSPSSVTLAASVPNNVTNATAFWYPAGQDDTNLLQAAINGCTPDKTLIRLVGEVFVISSTLTGSEWFRGFIGDTALTSWIVVNNTSFTGDMLFMQKKYRTFRFENVCMLHSSVKNQTTTSTAWSTVSNLLTITATNTYSAGQAVKVIVTSSVATSIFGKVWTSTDFWGTVNASGLSGSSFNISLPFTVSDGSGTDDFTCYPDWNCINFSRETGTILENCKFSQLFLWEAPGSGLALNNIITSKIEGIQSQSNGGCGIEVIAILDGSTSCTFDNCYMNGNTAAGYYVHQLTYSSFNGCAADSNSVAYYLNDSTGISFSGSSCEATVFYSNALPGNSLKMLNGTSVTVNGWRSFTDPAGSNTNTIWNFINCNNCVFNGPYFSGLSNLPNPAGAPATYAISDAHGTHNVYWEPYFGAIPLVPLPWSVTSTDCTLFYNGEFHTNSVEFGYELASPTILQEQVTTDVQGQPMLIQAQKALAGGTQNGGSLTLASGTNGGGGSTGVAGTLKLQYGNTIVGQFGQADTDFISLGVSPTASAGRLRFASGVSNMGAFRNAANTNDVTIFGADSSNNVIFGESVNDGGLYMRSSNTINMQKGTSTAITWTNNATGANTQKWVAGATSITIGQTATSTANGANLAINSQVANVTGFNGGTLIIGAGDGYTTSGGTGTGGTLQLSAGNGITANGNIKFGVGSASYSSALIWTINPTGSNTMAWQSGVTSVDINQNAATSDVATSNITITTQAPYTSATSSNRVPGNLLLNIPAPTNGGTTHGHISIQDSGTTWLQILNDNVNSQLAFQTGAVAPKIFQVDNTTNSATAATMLVQAQNATGTTATGGDLTLTSGTGTTAAGAVRLSAGGVTALRANATGVITIPNLNAGGIVHADGSGNLTASTIVNADVSTSAAIAVSKLAAGTSAQILQNNGTPTPTWTTVSGDVSITNAGVTTVTALQGNAVQSGALTSLQDGYVLEWVNASSQWQAKPGSSTLVDGQDYAFSNTSSDVSGYDQLFDNATGSEADLSVAVTSGGGKQLIKAFASVASSPQVELIPAGLWEFNLYGYASVLGAFTTNLVVDVYTRTAGGTETLLFTVNSPNLTVTSVGNAINFTYNNQVDTYIANTTRVVVKISAITTSVTSVTAHFVFDGTTHTSLVRTPIAGASLQLGGDLSGTTSSATVLAVNGTTVPATPSANQLIVATNGTTASWTSTLPGNYSFTGTPTFSNALALGSSTATTQSAGDNSTKIATTAYADRNFYLPTVAGFRDDFITMSSGSSITTATSLNSDSIWSAIQISGGTQTATTQDGTFTNPGQLIITTSAVSGQGMAMYKGANIGGLGNLAAQAGWDCHIVLKISTTSTIAFRAGFCGTGQRAADAPTSGIWVRYDTTPGDTQFTFETRSASTSTTSTTNSINADTNFHHFRIRSTSAGTVLFSIDGGTETSIATNVPTTAQMPFLQILTRTTATVSLTLDFFSYLAATTRT